MDRPSFPLETLADIERARDEVFKSAESRFDMLFFSIVPGILFGGVLATAKNVPLQRKPATLKLQLKEYTSALFDAEARHYLNFKPTDELLCLWLGDLVERINKEVRAIAEDERHSRHCGLQERLSAVTDALAARAQWWLQAKQRIDPPKPAVKVAPPQQAGAVQQMAKALDTDEVSRRKALLADYKTAAGNPSNRKIYTARNSNIHKPQFHEWLTGSLPQTSQTCVNFERFLRDKKLPIPRKPKEA
jgi:hypothetical protein